MHIVHRSIPDSSPALIVLSALNAYEGVLIYTIDRSFDGCVPNGQLMVQFSLSDSLS